MAAVNKKRRRARRTYQIGGDSQVYLRISHIEIPSHCIEIWVVDSRREGREEGSESCREDNQLLLCGSKCRVIVVPCLLPLAVRAKRVPPRLLKPGLEAFTMSLRWPRMISDGLQLCLAISGTHYGDEKATATLQLKDLDASLFAPLAESTHRTAIMWLSGSGWKLRI